MIKKGVAKENENQNEDEEKVQEKKKKSPKGKTFENLYIFANFISKNISILICIYLITNEIKCFPMYFLIDLFLLLQIVC